MATPVPTPIPTPQSAKPPKPPKPPKPTPQAHTPYNPLVGGMPSLGFLTNTANQHALADANQAIAALPSADDVRALATATAHLQQQNEARLAQQAASAGGAYSSAYNQAANPSNTAMIASGGQAGSANPAASGMLGALGTLMGQALGGQAAAANAQGANDIRNIGRQASQIRQGIPAASAKYLDALKQEAFQVAQARQNNALANAQFGNTVANDQAQNAVAAQNAATSAQNSANSAANAAANRADKAAAAQQKKAAADKAAARAAVNHMEAMVRQMLAASTPAPDTYDANGNVIHHSQPKYTQDAVRKAAVVYLMRNGNYGQEGARRVVMQMFPFLPAPPVTPVATPPGAHGPGR